MFTPEFAITFRNLMVDVLAREAEVTTAILAAVPVEQHAYRPHPASRSAWELAWHIAADVWFLEGIANLAFEQNPDQTHPNPARNGNDLSVWFRERVNTALAAIRAMPADKLLRPLAIGVSAQTAQQYPTFLYLFWAHNHFVHHRGQLSAYLRPMGSKVPNIYGASGDNAEARS